MGFFQACKDFLGIDSGYDEYDDFYETNEEEAVADEAPRANTYDYAEEEEPIMDGGFFSGRKFSKRNEARNMTSERPVTNRMSGYSGNSGLRVVLCNPTEFDNCPMICDHLRSHMTVVLNLENVKSATEKRRIFDFVSGCCFALDCNIRKISEPVYVVAPANVDLLSEVDFKESGENKNYFDTDYGF